MARRGVLMCALVASCAALAPACDFGTLDDLNADETTQGADELSVQARAIWDVYGDPKTDDDVKKAISGIEGVVERAGVPAQLKLSQLTKDDLATIGFQDKDPTHAQGMLVITEIDCSLDQITGLLVAKNQTTLYPDLYDKYDRSYTSDVQAFLSGASKTVGWHTSYSASVLDRAYEATVTGGARRVPGAMPSGATVLLSRAYLDTPAHFTKGDDSAFDQDYQVELYYERAPNKVLHFYGLWRQFNISTLTSESDLYVNIVLGNLSDFDVRSSKVCRDNNPQPAFQ